MAIDMEQFHQVFFEESLEGLDIMEQSLLAISSGDSDPESINTIFRAAHSIKGGSGTFGFSDVADFTHILETLLDEAREGSRELTEECIELLLKSCDCLRDMINRIQAKEETDTSTSQSLIDAFNRILSGESAEPNTQATTNASVVESDSDFINNATSEASASNTPPAPTGDPNDILMNTFDTMLNGDSSNGENNESANNEGKKHWRIQFIPEPQILLTGNEPVRIFRELESLGELTAQANIDKVPDFNHLTPDECFISWSLQLISDATKDDILEVFDWVIDECELIIQEGEQETASEEPSQETTVNEQAPVTPAAPQTTTSQASAPAPAVNNETTAPLKAPAETEKTETKTAAASGTSSIRVGIDKVDSLINLVGELVITQSMLSELGNNFEMDKLERLSNGLEQLLQNTKELQESVMRIRMLPISFAFNRFPRMIRDLSIKTGKKVELLIHGENTELDKTVMEQISDPLVHLVRNSIDHGIETAEERIQKGKAEQGTIKLDAYHQGGNIVIEVTDDGKGLNPEVIFNKAVEKGLIDQNTHLSNQEIFDLIFAPGFSTAKEVSDISGRGVGMDVVKRNIKALGGRIFIDSTMDVGTTIKVHLPLTLAILDGQLVRVGKEVYIIPLLAIVESLQIKPELVNKVAGNTVLYRLRDDNVPIIPIYKEFEVEADHTELDNALLVVVEGDGQKVGLLVDDLLAQQQVVIKSLESNYQRIEGISGATILGDGSVSMILDIPGLISSASKRSKNNKRDQAA